MFYSPTENAQGKIRVTQVEIAGPELTLDHQPIVLSPEMNEAIFHDVALLAAEEWIHALRFKKGIDAHSETVDGPNVDEAQVALYMLQKGVPLTERFLTQYDRRGQLRAMGYQV